MGRSRPVLLAAERAGIEQQAPHEGARADRTEKWPRALWRIIGPGVERRHIGRGRAGKPDSARTPWYGQGTRPLDGPRTWGRPQARQETMDGGGDGSLRGPGVWGPAVPCRTFVENGVVEILGQDLAGSRCGDGARANGTCPQPAGLLRCIGRSFGLDLSSARATTSRSCPSCPSCHRRSSQVSAGAVSVAHDTKIASCVRFRYRSAQRQCFSHTTTVAAHTIAVV